MGDREAIDFEKQKLEGRFIESRGNVGKVQDTKTKLEDQLVNLKKIRADKGSSTAPAPASSLTARVPLARSSRRSLRWIRRLCSLRRTSWRRWAPRPTRRRRRSSQRLRLPSLSRLTGSPS